MSTVMEPEVKQFFPPKIKVGSQVVFYSHADRNAVPSLAVATLVGQTTIECVVGGVRGKYSVHHIDDPGLALNPEWRDFGAWDLTDDAKMLARVMERLAAIEAQFAALKADKARQQDGGKK